MSVPPSAARAGLEIEGLVVGGDGRPAVTVPRLRVAAGTCAVVTGAPGAGASTLAAGIAGHLPATGEVRVGGRRCTGPPSRRRRAGLAAVLPELPRIAGCSVTEALALAARGRSAAEGLDRFPVLAARAGLRAERLSGGEHLLLRTACAWVATPSALVLDSPTAGLAEALVADVVDLARQEAARGAAVLWIDRDGAPTPAPPAWRLGGGTVSAPARSRTGSTTATG